VTKRPASPRGASTPEEPVVLVVDDDPSLREALSSLLRSVGLRVEVFGSAPEPLETALPDACCLVLDIRLPKRSGLDFQSELIKANIRIPFIFFTAHGDVPMSVRAMKAGAVDSCPSRSAIRTCSTPSPSPSSAIGNGGRAKKTWPSSRPSSRPSPSGSWR
jgi:CheY-like chemotaxis protein